MGNKKYAVLTLCFGAAFGLASSQAFGGTVGAGFHREGEPGVIVAAPRLDKVRYTCTLDIPWDWPHRCPPIVAHSEPDAYPVVGTNAPGCPAQAVKVLGADGKEHTVMIVRCP